LQAFFVACKLLISETKLIKITYKKILNEPFKFGHSKGTTIQLDEMLSEYYKLRSWNQKGKISKSKLSELDLTEEAGKG